MDAKQDFTSGSIVGKMMQFMIPILGAQILQAMYGAVDMLVVGHFGTNAGISGVSTGSSIMNLVTFVLSQLAAGVAHVGLVVEGDAQRAAQVKKYRLVTLLQFHIRTPPQFLAGKISSSWLRLVITWSGVNSLPVAFSMFRVSGSSMRIIMAKPAAWVPSTSRTGLSPT